MYDRIQYGRREREEPSYETSKLFIRSKNKNSGERVIGCR